ncbi:hypothetical protein HS125_05115 [bacterium]|nr:hypothetical protein [bacterium]
MVQFVGAWCDARRPSSTASPASCITTAAASSRGLENPLRVGRYHSLVGCDLPPEFAVTATAEGLVMAASHEKMPLAVCSSTPESVLTPTEAGCWRTCCAGAARALSVL